MTERLGSPCMKLCLGFTRCTNLRAEYPLYSHRHWTWKQAAKTFQVGPPRIKGLWEECGEAGKMLNQYFPELTT